MSGIGCFFGMKITSANGRCFIMDHVFPKVHTFADTHFTKDVLLFAASWSEDDTRMLSPLLDSRAWHVVEKSLKDTLQEEKTHAPWDNHYNLIIGQCWFCPTKQQSYSNIYQHHQSNTFRCLRINSSPNQQTVVGVLMLENVAKHVPLKQHD